MLKAKKRDFYDGLLRDLLNQQAYALAQIVYSEKIREKFEATVADQLIGLEIFASQRKLEEFTELYNKLLEVPAAVPKKDATEVEAAEPA